MLDILTVPNPVLRQKSAAVSTVDPKLVEFIGQLSQTLKRKRNPSGVGLSAVQVGNPIRVFVTQMPQDPDNEELWKKGEFELTHYINPQLEKVSKKVSLGEIKDQPFMEGCLSIPGIWGPVWRHHSITLSFQILTSAGNLKPVTQAFSGFAARVIQHEFDHLEGILFTDYVLNTSPAASFKSLGTIDDVFFEQDDEFVPIKNPQTLLTW